MRILSVVLSLLTFAAAAPSQEPPSSPFADQSFVTAIQLSVKIVDRHGETPRDLTPADFVLLENGVERPVIGVEYPVAPVPEISAIPRLDAPQASSAAPWQIVVWVDATTTSQGTIRRESRELAAQASALAALGPVTVVWANPAVETLVEATRDAERLASALESLGSRLASDQVARLRRRFLADLDRSGQPGFEIEAAARLAVQEEALIIQTARGRMLEWISRLPRTGPRALLFVGDGYDLDPARFYARNSIPLLVELQRYSQSLEHENAARELALTGWTAFGIGGTSAAHFASDATLAGTEKARAFLRAESQEMFSASPHLVLNPLDPFNAVAHATGGSVVGSSRNLPAILDDLANRVVVTYQVPRAPDTEPRKVELRSRRAGLEVSAPRWASSTSPASLAEGRAVRFVEGAELERGDLPVVLLIRDNPPASAGAGKRTVEATVDLGPLADVAERVGKTVLRITVAVGGDEALPTIVRETVPVDLRELRWYRWSAPLVAGVEKDRLAVVIEELTTGAWGGAIAPLDDARHARRTLEAAGLGYRRSGELAAAADAFTRLRELALAEGDRAAAQSAEVDLGLVRLQGGETAAALAHFENVARDPASPSNRAEALLGVGQARLRRGDEAGASDAFLEAARLAPDGSEARAAAIALAGASRDRIRGAVPQMDDLAVKPLQLIVRGRPPFSGRVEAQALVRDPAIDEVVFLLDDVELGRDAAPPFRRRVELGEVPRPRKLRASALDRRGAVVADDLLVLNERHDHFWIDAKASIGGKGIEARAEIGVPVGRRVERVDFFIDGQLVRALAEPPWNAKLPGGSGSVLRVLARLDDGTTAEDALLLDPSGYAESVEIHDVELYATVVDADGEPVRGLRSSDFTVREEGTARPIHGFEFLEQAPWTAGIAIDSSGSMEKRMAEVRAAAKGFASRTIENGGRAFVVDFDTTPRLAHPTSAAAASVSAAIDRIGAGGDTALWDAIIFSLLQLQGVDGKRALVVLSDGRNLESRYRYADVERVARETGAAVYVIVVPARYSPADQAAMYERNALATLARSTGGEVWFQREGDSLAAVYETIDRQLRSQYVLTYRTEPARGTDDWRKVDVRLSDRKLRARTIAGYFAR